MKALFIPLLIGVIGGACGGLLGLAGGLVIIPLSVFILNMSQHTAQGTSLFAILFPISLFGVIRYYQNGNVDIRNGLLISLGLFLGSFLGASLAVHINPPLMKKIFAIFLFVMGAMLLIKK